MTLDQGKQPIRVAIIGTAGRSSYLYGPLLEALPGEVNLVSVWGRTAESAKKLGESLGVPWYTDIGKLVKETAPEIHQIGDCGNSALIIDAIGDGSRIGRAI